ELGSTNKRKVYYGGVKRTLRFNAANNFSANLIFVFFVGPSG
ncbi:unnamed protein product, partial [Allacma fusca]